MAHQIMSDICEERMAGVYRSIRRMYWVISILLLVPGGSICYALRSETEKAAILEIRLEDYQREESRKLDEILHLLRNDKVALGDLQ